MKPTFFKSAADLRRWFEKHHATVPELQVGFYKKALGRGITYPEALDEALSFGWIDGVRRGIDVETYTIRFTPRRPRSNWSEVNTRRVRELLSQGRMKPPGIKAFQSRDERKAAQYTYERDLDRLDPALDAALRTNPKAASFFDAQPPGYRKTATNWVMSAKKE
jgi:uncharacterized protein YdeI (YjbR/CyaY-like superfamily)